jgi:hypothetical protein
MVVERREEADDHIDATYGVYIHRRSIMVTTIQHDTDGGLRPHHTSTELHT